MGAMADMFDVAGPGPGAGQRGPNAPADEQLLSGIGRKYKALAPFINNSAVMNSPDPGDGRQLEFYHPASSENPHPGSLGFELFKPMQGAEREDAIAADALHYLGGRQQDDSGPPVDPKWSGMRDQLWQSRTSGQRAVDSHSYEQEHEPGQTPDAWADRNRKDAYVRAGVFPERNPDWNRGPDDPMGWTPGQQNQFGRMSTYLRSGEDPEPGILRSMYMPRTPR